MIADQTIGSIYQQTTYINGINLICVYNIKYNLPAGAIIFTFNSECFNMEFTSESPSMHFTTSDPDINFS